MAQAKKRFLIFIISVLFFIGMIIAILISTKPTPIVLLQEYKLSTLWHDGQDMNSWAESARLHLFHKNQSPTSIIIIKFPVETNAFTLDDVLNTIIAKVHKKSTLILPERVGSAWTTDFVGIESK